MNPLSGRLLLHAEELEETIKEKTQYLNDEILIRKKAEEKLAKNIKNLHKAHTEVKTLSGLLPICSKCKKKSSKKNNGYVPRSSRFSKL
jgi:hypothetical protein